VKARVKSREEIIKWLDERGAVAIGLNGDRTVGDTYFVAGMLDVCGKIIDVTFIGDNKDTQLLHCQRWVWCRDWLILNPSDENEDSLEKEACEGDPETVVDHACPPDNYYAHKGDQGKTDWGLIPEECYRAITFSNTKMFWAKILRLSGKKHIKDGETFYVLLPGIRDVLEEGAREYGRETWKITPDARQRYFAAYLRHTINDKGEVLPVGHADEKSGRLSIYHALCNCLFLLYFEIQESKES
jgi:hypothetical protein